MSKSACLFIGAMFCLVTTTAEAQNPFSGLLDSIEKVVKPAADKSQTANSSMVEILKTYAAANTVLGAVDACNVIASGFGYQKLEADFKLGDYVNASSGYLIAAKNVAQCAVGPIGASQITRIPLSQAIDQTGIALGMSVLADKAGGLVTQQSRINAKNALKLLDANNKANEELIRNVKETGLAGDAAPAKVSNAKPISMTAKDAVSAFKRNQFAFKSKYDGKVLTISGPIQSINGSAKKATVTLVGYKHADINNQGFQDIVRCEISDQTALAKAMNLKSGKTIKVTGQYKPATQSLPMGIELQNCQPD